MTNKSDITSLFKIALPIGFLIAFCWFFSQLAFYSQGWAQPGTTSISLFLIQVSSILILLLLSFRWYRDRFQGGFVSFRRLMLQGILTGISVVVFGIIIFQIYVNFINPAHLSWLDEMYNLSWIQRGMTEIEIQNQRATNEWLNSMDGFAYAFFFVVGLTTLFSIPPAILTARNGKKSEDLWSPEIA